MAKLRLGVIFGAPSVEHEVSIITAIQLMKHADPAKYEVVPIYIDKQGHWLSGQHLRDLAYFKQLDSVATRLHSETPKTEFAQYVGAHLEKIDVAIICCHGDQGENGSVQGLLELTNTPYQGPGVLGSAVCMDKVASRHIVAAAGIPVTKYTWFTKTEWDTSSQEVLSKVSALQYPLYIKPANLGSSIGITKVKSPESLADAIAIAISFDDRVLVEESVEDCIEVNVSVLGYNEFSASVTEQPIKSGEILSYADKYETGGGKKSGMASLNRRIPAPISNSLGERIRGTAVQAARLLDCSGVIRIDFLVDPSANKFWLNEVNTIPGSMSFYLWQASGVEYPILIDKLVAIAQQRKASQKSKVRSIQTTIIK